VAITIDDLTVNFAHLDRDTLLEDWHWLIGPAKLPVLLTAIGDAFVQDTGTGAVSMLDTAAGELVPVAADADAFRALLGDREFVMGHFAVNAVMDLRAGGLELGEGQIYSWKVPPVLGGEYAFANAEATDISVHFSLTGQIHEKVGTPIRDRS
jgi:Domain of unknown function (DUF1851)